MLEVRFRVSHPPSMPAYYAPWFARSREGRVYAPEVRFDGDVGEASFLAIAEDGSLDLFVEDTLKLPMVPRALEWTLMERCEGSSRFAGRWSEPCFGVPSPMYFLRQKAGEAVACSLLYHPESFVVRALIPGSAADASLWLDMKREFLQYRENVGVPAMLELEHLAPYHEPSDSTTRDVPRAAFSLGCYDAPARASARDIATATGIPQAAVLARLKAAEQRILEGLHPR